MYWDCSSLKKFDRYNRESGEYQFSHMRYGKTKIPFSFPGHPKFSRINGKTPRKKRNFPDLSKPNRGSSVKPSQEKQRIRNTLITERNPNLGATPQYI